jgi:hypothetical protein
MVFAIEARLRRAVVGRESFKLVDDLNRSAIGNHRYDKAQPHKYHQELSNIDSSKMDFVGVWSRRDSDIRGFR